MEKGAVKKETPKTELNMGEIREEEKEQETAREAGGGAHKGESYNAG